MPFCAAQASSARLSGLRQPAPPPGPSDHGEAVLRDRRVGGRRARDRRSRPPPPSASATNEPPGSVRLAPTSQSSSATVTGVDVAMSAYPSHGQRRTPRRAAPGRSATETSSTPSGGAGRALVCRRPGPARPGGRPPGSRIGARRRTTPRRRRPRATTPTAKLEPVRRSVTSSRRSARAGAAATLVGQHPRGDEPAVGRGPTARRSRTRPFDRPTPRGRRACGGRRSRRSRCCSTVVGSSGVIGVPHARRTTPARAPEAVRMSSRLLTRREGLPRPRRAAPRSGSRRAAARTRACR